jgi:hypothetical protein
MPRSGRAVRGLLAGVLIALLSAPAAAVGAAAPHKPPPPPPKHTFGDDDDVSPSSARLQLEGSGIVRLEGRLVTYGLIPDGATLWVRDSAGDARFFLDGSSRRLRTGAMVRIRDASGRIYLSGSRVVLQIKADDISLSTAGRGKASVSGDGAFTLNDGRERLWPSRSRNPLKFAFQPPQRPSSDDESDA